MFLISVFGEKVSNKFSHKGNLLTCGEVASASSLPEIKDSLRANRNDQIKLKLLMYK